MSAVQLGANGLACFMIGINTLTVAVFFGDWLLRQFTAKVKPCNDPQLATTICVLAESWHGFEYRDMTEEVNTAIRSVQQWHGPDAWSGP